MIKVYPSCPIHRASGIHLFLFISLTLNHFPIIPCFFQKKSVSLQKKRYSPIMEICFSDMALPIHNFTYIQANRTKSVKLRQPSWYLLIHPSHNIYHFIVYHLNFIEIPTNSFIMIILLRKRRNLFKELATTFLCRLAFFTKGKALLKSFQRIRS